MVTREIIIESINSLFPHSGIDFANSDHFDLVELMMLLEKDYNILFDVDDLLNINNLDDLVSCINKKL
ncbi:MAG: acyl carrier protein [Erysipelotrichaceae bacterium]